MIDYIAVHRRLGCKILSYVGNISDNKNQYELIQLMPKLKAQNVIAVLAGSLDDDRVPVYIGKHDLQESVILTGFCSELDSIWENTDVNVFLSKNDGFGLSIIEAGMRGIPSVVFDDLDCASDIEGDGVCLIDRKGSVDTLIHALTGQYASSRQKILEHFKSFSLENMSRDYIKVYENILSGIN